MRVALKWKANAKAAVYLQQKANAYGVDGANYTTALPKKSYHTAASATISHAKS